jgi:hypothetical protein
MNATGQPTSAVKLLDPGYYCPGTEWCYVDPRWRVVAVGDITGDGLADEIVQTPLFEADRGITFGGPGGVYARLGQTLSWNAVSPYDPDGWTVVAAADLNRDGICDLVLQHISGYVAAWIMTASGMPADFVFIWPYEMDGWQVVGTIDLNGDGVTDLLLQYPDGQVAAWTMNEAGQPVDFVWVWPYDAGPWRVNAK